MGTTGEQITNLAQQLDAMQTDVAELQNAPQGSATKKCRSYGAAVHQRTQSKDGNGSLRRGDSSHVKIANSGDDKHHCDDERCTEVQRQSSDTIQATCVEGSESFKAFRMELQNWVGSMHHNMMKVMDVAEASEGRLMELDVRNAGMSQQTVDDFKETDRKLYQVLISFTKGEANYYVCNPERSGFKAWKPSTGADRSVANARVTHPGSQSCRVPGTSCNVGTRDGRVLHEICQEG